MFELFTGGPTTASDVAVADTAKKRIVIVARGSRNAFLVEDATPVAVPLFGPISPALPGLAVLSTPVVARRRSREDQCSLAVE